MKQRLVLSVMVALAAACVAGSAGAQVLTNSLPAGVTVGDFAGLVFSPEQTVLGKDNFNVTKFTANVSYAIATAAGAPGDYFYFYKVNPTNFVLTNDSIARVTVNFETTLAKKVGPVTQFGQYEAGGAGPLSLVAATVDPNKLSWDKTPLGDGLFAGETSYLWVVSTYPGNVMVSLQAIDGGVGTARVPAPAPEPVSMVLAGLGLSAVAGLRKRGLSA